LRAVEIGGVRGFSGQRIEFRFPVVAIAEMNGAGKSTALAAAACGYHQAPGAFFHPPLQTPARPYYVFSSFFVGSQHDGFFDGATFRWDHRGYEGQGVVDATKGSSKWMHYERRPRRSVVYLGMERVLPAVGRRVLRSHFGGRKAISGRQFNTDQLALAQYLMNSSHTAAERADSAAHHLYGLTTERGTYTSFHMGAGEEVMCELADLIPRLPNGSLLLIEEAEIGLHPAYQEQLVKMLITQADKRQIQTIITTHSGHILDLLPREGTVFLSRLSGELQVEYEVSSQLATSLLSGHPTSELEIYVEDTVAQQILQEALPTQLRRRVHTTVCGSWLAVVGQMAAHQRNDSLPPCLAVLDGDVSRSDAITQLRKQFNHCDDNLEAWYDEHATALPGEGCPERSA